MGDVTAARPRSAGTGRRPLLPAVVAPDAGYVIARDFGSTLEDKAHSVRAAQPELADHLLAAVAQLRESGRQWHAAVFGTSPTREPGVCGTAEVPQSSQGAESGRPLEVTVPEAAARLRVSEEYVRKLCHSECLVAVRGPGRGRPWQIDRLSLDLEARRREQENAR